MYKTFSCVFLSFSGVSLYLNNISCAFFLIDEVSLLIVFDLFLRGLNVSFGKAISCWVSCCDELLENALPLAELSEFVACKDGGVVGD